MDFNKLREIACRLQGGVMPWLNRGHIQPVDVFGSACSMTPKVTWVLKISRLPIKACKSGLSGRIWA